MLRLRTAAPPPGYRYFHLHEEAPSWRDDATLLSGAAGTGLVLLAACEPREPEWQRLFLI